MPFLLDWCDQASFCLCEGTPQRQFTIKEYIFQFYKTEIEKYTLCNEIFLSYGLYDEVIVAGDNFQLRLQKIKSEFRLGHYTYVIEQSETIVESNAPRQIMIETLYYLSSALYYICDYKKAMELAKKCVCIGWKMRDMDFYLNSLINYASIQYMYASTLSCRDEQANILKRAQRIYRIVQKRAEGTFMNHYNIPFLPDYALQEEMRNPLFLMLFCETYSKDNAELFRLFDRYVKLPLGN